MFWGQLNEAVEIVSRDKLLECAKQATNREVFKEEFADRAALREELEARIGSALNILKLKIQPLDERK